MQSWFVETQTLTTSLVNKDNHLIQETNWKTPSEGFLSFSTSDFSRIFQDIPGLQGYEISVYLPTFSGSDTEMCMSNESPPSSSSIYRINRNKTLLKRVAACFAIYHVSRYFLDFFPKVKFCQHVMKRW